MDGTFSIPASRVFLWDRTSAGEPVLLKAEVFLIRIQRL